MTNDSKAKFRKKANSITQQPSLTAWDKLAKKLDEPKKSKPVVKRFTLFAIAASVAVLFGLMLNWNLSPKASLAQANFEVSTVEVLAPNNLDKGLAVADKRASAVSATPRELLQNPYESFYQRVMEARQGMYLNN